MSNLNPDRIYDYLKVYQQNPNSKIFAPLAEAYRKAGRLDEAMEIALDGVSRFPDYPGGKVALARIYFDRHQYLDVVSRLEEVCADHPDNLSAQKLMAESLLVLGREKESLNHFKYLLLGSPSDDELKNIVSELESRLEGVVLSGGFSLGGKSPLMDEAILEGNSGIEFASSAMLRRSLWAKKMEVLQRVLARIHSAESP